jgi:hypothetical protein
MTPAADYRADWSAQWPTEPGRYWAYGYAFGPAREGSKPRLDLCEVVKLSGKSPTYIVRGNFAYPGSAGPTVFTPAVVPSVPDTFGPFRA